jgi:hypothetical protein
MTEVRPAFFPSADGVRDVMRRARARRRRRALVTTGGFAVVAAVTGVLIGAAGTGTGADRLSVVPAGPDHSGSQSAPSSTGPSAHARPSPSSVRPAGSGPVLPGQQPSNGDGGSGSAGHDDAFPAPTPTPSTTPYAPTKRQSADAPITRTTVGYNTDCDATYDVQGWCELYTGPSQGRRKHVVTFAMELCRPSVVGDGTVHFTSTRQVYLQLSDSNGEKVWQAGQGIAYKNKTFALVVKAGTCLRWTSSWDTIAANGFYAPPGGYTVSFGLDSSDVSTVNGGDSFTLTD